MIKSYPRCGNRIEIACVIKYLCFVRVNCVRNVCKLIRELMI